MPQPSISSFFKPKSDSRTIGVKDEKNEKQQQNLSDKSSEIKMESSTNKKSPSRKPSVKRKLIIDSDSESNEEPIKVNNKISKINTDTNNNMENSKSKESCFIPEINPADYNPLKTSYDIVKDACWKKNEKVPYLALAKTFSEIEGVSSRLKKIEAFSNFLRSVIYLSPQDLINGIYLCLNQVAPQYEGIELNIGESIVVNGLASVTGTSISNLRTKNQSIGDYGVIAYEMGNKQTFLMQHKPLTMHYVFTKYKQVARISGKSTQKEKINLIRDLLLSSKSIERKYLVRGLTGKLGIQFAEQSVLTALGNAVALTNTDGDIVVKKKSDEAEKKQLMDESCKIVKKAFCECPNFDLLIKKLLEFGVNDLDSFCTVCPGVPVKPMLAHPSKGMGEVLKRFDEDEFTCEYKYDGERAQIHVYKGKGGDEHTVNVFSRNQENNTQKYPDIISMMKDILADSSVESCILDSEAVAWDPETQSIRPFQELSTRKRKDVKEEDIKIQVCVYAFDLIYFNGESLVEKSLRERRKILYDNFSPLTGKFMFATSLDSSDLDEISVFLEQSIKDKCEGLMLKTLDNNASYEISKRSRRWLKLKKDYLDGLGDSVDLVVIGAYHGQGKRAHKFGAFLMACYDKESEQYQAICKLGTGFKDADLDRFYERLSEEVVRKPQPSYVISSSKPDVWFPPKFTWEVKAADLSLSPDYMAGLGLVDKDKGISLRFPRFLKEREDKSPEDATDSKQIAIMYRNQDNVTVKEDAYEEDEFY